MKITGLTEAFGIYATVDQAIAAAKGRRQDRPEQFTQHPPHHRAAGDPLTLPL